jgi:hypothetical protein
MVSISSAGVQHCSGNSTIGCIIEPAKHGRMIQIHIRATVALNEGKKLLDNV